MIEAVFDPGTRNVLTACGVEEGWRCWEVGAGAGSIARWLAARVGEKGHVLATDVSIKLLGESEAENPENLELRRHDVLADDPPEGEFDLVHSRLVLEHLPGRQEALRRMAGALAPGGVLVVEDMDWTSTGASTRRGVGLTALLTAARIKLRANGYDPYFGRRLPAHLAQLGLVDVGAEGRVVVLVGGSPMADQVRPSLDRFQMLVLESSILDRLPVLRDLARRPFDRVDRLLSDPEFVFAAPTLMAAWARKP